MNADDFEHVPLSSFKLYLIHFVVVLVALSFINVRHGQKDFPSHSCTFLVVSEKIFL